MPPDDLTRRQTLALLGAAALVGCSEDPPPDTTPRDTDGDGTVDDCATPTGAQTEGPFYPGEPAVRVDITEGLPGVSLDVDLTVVSRETCEPVVGAEVDLWGADASGAYSGYADFGTEGETWMRGQQATDAEGVARFGSVVPGSYPGRAVHLHVKVRAPGRSELTTQIYLPDAVVEEALADAAYAEGAAITTLARDGFYAGDTLCDVEGTPAEGLRARVTLVV